LKFPFLVQWEIPSKRLIPLVDQLLKILIAGVKRAKFPLFSHLSGNLMLETGSWTTASTTTQFSVGRDFLETRE
jgi:hypothetical protein